MLAAASAAVGRARAGDGPTFLECLTYRFDAHHTWEHTARPALPDGRGGRRRQRPGSGADPGRAGARGGPRRDRRRDRAAAGRGRPVRAGQSRARPGRRAGLPLRRRPARPDRGSADDDPVLPAGAQPGAGRGDGARSGGVRVRRGHRGGGQQRHHRPAQALRSGPGDRHADLGAGVHQRRHRRRDGRRPAGDRVPDPGAALPGVRADRQPGPQVLADDRRPAQGAGHLPAAEFGLAHRAGPASIPTTPTACSPTSASRRWCRRRRPTPTACWSARSATTTR